MDDEPGKPKWQLTPEESDRLPAFTQDDWSRVLDLEDTKHLRPRSNPQYSTRRRAHWPGGYRIVLKPPLYTFGAGIPGVLLVIAQFWLPTVNEMMGSPLGSYVGLVRLAMILLGAGLGLVAAPLHVKSDRLTKEEEQLRSDRDYFRGKRRA